MLLCGLGLLLYSNLYGQSKVENKLSEVSKVLNVSSEGSSVHNEVDSPFVEGTIIS